MGRPSVSEGRNGVTLGARLAAVIVSLAPWPAWWYPQAMCIHRHEGAWNANTGNGYYGGFQFLASTWRSVGGQGLASDAAPRDQLFRAFLVYRRDGNSWREWGTARACGLR